MDEALSVPGFDNNHPLTRNHISSIPGIQVQADVAIAQLLFLTVQNI